MRDADRLPEVMADEARLAAWAAERYGPLPCPEHCRCPDCRPRPDEL